jgi:hypothetical protein
MEKTLRSPYPRSGTAKAMRGAASRWRALTRSVRCIFIPAQDPAFAPSAVGMHRKRSAAGRSRRVPGIRRLRKSAAPSGLKALICTINKSKRILAERQRFELWIRFRVYTLSKRAPSATRPSLRVAAGRPRSRGFRGARAAINLSRIAPAALHPAHGCGRSLRCTGLIASHATKMGYPHVRGRARLRRAPPARPPRR